MDISFFNHWCVKFAEKLRADFGFDDLDCAAILGNAGEESGGFQSLQEKKPLVPGSKGGYGIMQWTGPRRKDYESYCSRNKLDPADMESNYKFLFVELKGSEKGSVAKLKSARGLEAKTETFMKSFLRPGIPHLDLRISWARKALAAIQSTVPVEIDVPGAPPAETKTVEVSDAPRLSFWQFLLKLLGF